VRALRALADDDVAEITCGDVSVERLDRAVQLGGGLRGGLEPVRGLARLALAMAVAGKVGLGGGRAVARRKRKRMRERLAALKPFRQWLCNG